MSEIRANSELIRVALATSSPPGPLGSSVRDLTVSAKLTQCVTHTRTLLPNFAIIKLNANPNEQNSPDERGLFF